MANFNQPDYFGNYTRGGAYNPLNSNTATPFPKGSSQELEMSNKFNEAMAYASLTELGNNAIANLTSPNLPKPIIVISDTVTSGGTTAYTSGPHGVIFWDPNQSMIIRDKTGRITGIASPVEVLLHEITHYYDQNANVDRGLRHPNSDKAKHEVKIPEQFAVDNINEYRKAVGARFRDTYAKCS